MTVNARGRSDVAEPHGTLHRTSAGRAGIAAILGRQPDVAIVDIGLPGIDLADFARVVAVAPRRAATSAPSTA